MARNVQCTGECYSFAYWTNSDQINSIRSFSQLLKKKGLSLQLPLSSQCLCFESYWPVCTLLKSSCVWSWWKLRHSSFLRKSTLFLVPFLYFYQERKRKWTVWICWSQRWMFLFWIDQSRVKHWPLSTPSCLHSTKSAPDIWKPFDCVGNACNSMARDKTAIVVPSVFGLLSSAAQ